MRNKLGNSLIGIDLFCGAGGFSLGAELAGVHSIASIDIDPVLQSAYRLNFPATNALCKDISSFKMEDWKSIIGSIRPDFVIGGPPCQGFSRIGKRDVADPRNRLIYQFYRNVKILRPKIFIMENVEGVLDAQNKSILFDAIDSISSYYTVIGPIVVNASQFGAATNRKRVIVIGFDKSDVDDISAIELATSSLPAATIKDAISDLPVPVPQSKGKMDFGWGKYSENQVEVSNYATILRRCAPQHLGWEISLAKHQSGFTSGLFDTSHHAEIANRYASVENGKVDKVSRSYKLSWNGLCPTLRAGTGSEKGSFQAVRPLHPDEGRVITVREAARIQGFPDWFVFHPTKWHSFRMIGNSVSPLAALGILSVCVRKVGLLPQNMNTDINRENLS